MDERHIIRALPNLDMPTLASIPEAFITAYQLCFVVGKVKAGDTVLLHAATSSVGQAAIQMLVRKGATVFGTVRSENKLQRCLDLGCKDVILISPSSPPDFCEEVKEANDGQPVNVILDPVGSAYLSENLDVLAVDGTIVLYGLMGGATVADAEFLKKMMAKRITMVASTLRSRSIKYKADLITLLNEDPDALAAIASGDIRVEVDRTFQLDQVIQAHAYMARNENIGKIVLMIASSVSAIDFFAKELEALAQKNKYRPTAYK